MQVTPLGDLFHGKGLLSRSYFCWANGCAEGFISSAVIPDELLHSSRTLKSAAWPRSWDGAPPECGSFCGECTK